MPEPQHRRLSLTSRGTRHEFSVGLALISAIPIMILWLLAAEHIQGQSVVSPRLAAGCAGALLCFTFLGYVILKKYPLNIARLRGYLEQMVRGEYPQAISLISSENDMKAIEQSMNILVGELKRELTRARSENDKLEKQLYKAQKLETIGLLAAGITHEIRAPVQFVRNNIAFVADGVKRLEQELSSQGHSGRAHDTSPGHQSRRGILSEHLRSNLLDLANEIKEAISDSEQGLTQVADIATAMRSYLHPGQGDKKTPVDINRLVEETITLSRNEWKYVADIEKDLAPDLPLPVCGGGYVRQALMNLLINAAAAIEAQPGTGDQKGLITITTTQRDSCVEIRIADTGTGIAKDLHGKIFDPFFTTKSPGNGTGLGLSLAHTFIVERQGGTLTFETEGGKGTTFIVRLPVEAGPGGAGRGVAKGAVRGAPAGGVEVAHTTAT